MAFGLMLDDPVFLEPLSIIGNAAPRVTHVNQYVIDVPGNRQIEIKIALRHEMRRDPLRGEQRTPRVNLAANTPDQFQAVWRPVHGRGCLAPRQRAEKQRHRAARNDNAYKDGETALGLPILQRED